MTQKQEYALNKVISALPEDCRDAIREVAEYAIALGYKPTLRGARENYIDFSKAKVKRLILKIATNPRFPFVSMKFFALPEYDGIFAIAVSERLAYWNSLGYEARCFGCGYCPGEWGYEVKLDDGTDGFLCGNGVLSLPSFTAQNVAEVKDALRVQDEFYMAQVTK